MNRYHPFWVHLNFLSYPVQKNRCTYRYTCIALYIQKSHIWKYVHTNQQTHKHTHTHRKHLLDSQLVALSIFLTPPNLCRSVMSLCRVLCAVLVALLACFLGFLSLLVDLWMVNPPEHHKAKPLRMKFQWLGSVRITPPFFGNAINIGHERKEGGLSPQKILRGTKTKINHGY